MKFLIPGLLVFNLLISGAVLGLALSGKIAVPAVEEVVDEEQQQVVEDEEPRQPFYFEIKPEIVVNFPGTERPRYMQLALTLVTYDEAALEALKLHSPVVRNDLLLMLSGLDSGLLMTREGKDEMRKKALETIRKIMLERYRSEAVEDVYITRFVMQ